MGQQAGDGLDDVADVLATAEVPGRYLPVLQMDDPALDPDAAQECAARRSCIFACQSGGVEGAWNELARLALSGSGWTAERVRTAGEALRAHFEAHGGEHTDRDRA